ncbi:MAG: 30S ribosomal protein S16 [Pirellulales bacterium]|nr:30S ribosomal protein S16 [Pirellulales bacterium]
MSVRIRMKQMGRTHRHFYRICATDTKNPRDGKVIEELGTYDPHIPLTDARVKFNLERLQYWLGVGALPSEHVAIFIEKYGPNGTHLDAQKAALEKLHGPRAIPDAGEAKFKRKTKEEIAAEQAAAEAAAAEAAAAEAAANAPEATATAEGMPTSPEAASEGVDTNADAAAAAAE